MINNYSEEYDNSMLLYYNYLKLIVNINQQITCDALDKNLLNVIFWINIEIYRRTRQHS
jgi:hypothetical protein